MIDYSLILTSKYNNKSWILVGDDYNGLQWNDSSPKPTKSELDSQWNEVLEITKKQNCKNEAKKRIQACDWSVLPDVKISNKLDFENYRTILRNYILNPVENPIFPPEPEPIWITD